MRLGLAATVVAVAALLFAEGVALPAAWLPLEEAPVLARARGHGADSLSAGLLYPLLLAPVARWASAEAAHTFALALSALLWALVAVPAFMLARRLVPPRAALVVAGLSAVVPGSVYATAAVPDALAVLLAVSALAAFPGWAAFPLAVAAALARPWFAVLPLALGVLYLRSPLRWPAPLGLAALVGIGYVALAEAAPGSANALADLGAPGRAALASLAVGAVGAGVVPWLLAPATDRVLALCAAALALAAGVLGTLPPGRGFDERPLLALTPLVLALAARAWLDGHVQLSGSEPLSRLRRRVAVGAGLVVLAAVALPELGRAPAARAAGLSVVAPDGGSRAYLVAVIAVAAVVAVLLVAVLRRWLVAAVALLLVVGQVAAWSAVRAEARALGDPPSWVDEAASGDARVVVTGPAEALDPLAVARLVVSNRSVRGAQALSFAEVDPNSGQLGPTPDAELLLVRGTELAGTEVARGAEGVLIRPDLPLHLAATVESLETGAWVYRRFSGAGRVVVSVAPPEGSEVRIEAGPLDEDADREVAGFTLQPGEQRDVEVELPQARYRVVVTAAPGAVVRFEYRPGP